MRERTESGVTVIELLVVVSLISLLLAVGVPRVEDFVIRARISEGLTVASAARQAMKATCATNPSARIRNPDSAGFHFEPTEYVAELIMAADCSKQRLWVGVITQNTGAVSDPYLAYVIVPTRGEQQFRWTCQLIRGESKHVPADCRIAGD